MVNISKLKGKIVERGLSIPKLSGMIGINKATLYRKIKAGGYKITIGEAELIATALKLNADELNSIFLIQKSHKYDYCKNEWRCKKKGDNMNEEKIVEQLHEIKIKLSTFETSLRIMVIELALILGLLIGISMKN